MQVQIENFSKGQTDTVKSALEKLNTDKMQIISITGDPKEGDDSFIGIVIKQGAINIRETNRCETKLFFHHEGKWYYYSDHAGEANSTTRPIDAPTIGEHFSTLYNDAWAKEHLPLH